MAKRREKEMEESMKRVREMKPPPENWEGMIKYRLEGLTNRRRLWLEYPEFFARRNRLRCTRTPPPPSITHCGSWPILVADIVLGTIAVVTVDVLGAEKEIDQLSTTCAALHWLHCIDNEGNMVAPRGIHLNFVGPEVPCDWKLIDPVQIT